MGFEAYIKEWDMGNQLSEEDYLRGQELYLAVDKYLDGLVSEKKITVADSWNVLKNIGIVLGVDVSEAGQ